MVHPFAAWNVMRNFCLLIVRILNRQIVLVSWKNTDLLFNQFNKLFYRRVCTQQLISLMRQENRLQMYTHWINVKAITLLYIDYCTTRNKENLVTAHCLATCSCVVLVWIHVSSFSRSPCLGSCHLNLEFTYSKKCHFRTSLSLFVQLQRRCVDVVDVSTPHWRRSSCANYSCPIGFGQTQFPIYTNKFHKFLKEISFSRILLVWCKMCNQLNRVRPIGFCPTVVCPTVVCSTASTPYSSYCSL